MGWSSIWDGPLYGVVLYMEVVSYMGWSLYGVVAIWGGRYMGLSLYRVFQHMRCPLYGVVAIWGVCNREVPTICGAHYMGWSLNGVVAI